jgi:SAM-dependent methyltransferase
MFSDGAAYERLMGRWSRVAGQVFLDWLDMPPHGRWLDVGCGNGAFTEAVIARCAPDEIIGIDPSEGQLAFARARPAARSAQFRVGDAQALTFASSRFDVAVMALVLAYLSDPARAVAEMARVARPGGWVATYVWDVTGAGAPVHPIYLAMESLGMPAPPAPGAEVCRSDTMRTLWGGAGLESIESHVIRIRVAYADFDDFWEANSAPAGASGKALRELSPAAREQVRVWLREHMHAGPDGRISYESFANAIKGRVSR